MNSDFWVVVATAAPVVVLTCIEGYQKLAGEVF
jgi:hypothetical protein